MWVWLNLVHNFDGQYYEWVKSYIFYYADLTRCYEFIICRSMFMHFPFLLLLLLGGKGLMFIIDLIVCNLGEAEYCTKQLDLTIDLIICFLTFRNVFMLLTKKPHRTSSKFWTYPTWDWPMIDLSYSYSELVLRYHMTYLGYMKIFSWFPHVTIYVPIHSIQNGFIKHSIR